MSIASACFEARGCERWLETYDEIESHVVYFFRNGVGSFSVSEDTLVDAVISEMKIRTDFSHDIFLCVMRNIRTHLEAFEEQSRFEFTAFHQSGKLWYSGSIPEDYSFDKYES